jgi:hypothetical protein
MMVCAVAPDGVTSTCQDFGGTLFASPHSVPTQKTNITIFIVVTTAVLIQ